MASIRIGLVGLGRHGMRYAQHLLQDVSDARLVAVSRRSRGEGERFGVEHGVRFYADYRQLVAAPDVDAVVLVTPPSAYRAICLEAIHHKKPILIEKPMGSSSVDAKEIVAAATASCVPLMTAHTMRFESAVCALKQNLADAGQPLYLALASRVEPRAEAQRDPGEYGGRGVLLEVGVHLLDLIRFLTEDEIREVRCETDVSQVGQPESRACVSLRTTRGLPCLLDVSRLGAGRVGRAEWIGREGQLLADWIHHRVCRLTRGTQVEEQKLEARPTLVEVLTAFVASLREGRPMPVTGLDGQRAVEIADACYESAATGRTISLED